MDPLILLAIGALILFVILKMFFGIARFVFRLGLLIIIVVIIWRFFVMRG